MTALRVLHVENEPDIRYVVLISLGHPDFINRSCDSGEEALAIAAGWLPDIILLDVTMPVMDGKAVLARLRHDNRTACIPVVFLTVCVQRREIELLLSLGAVGVIPKPFDPMTLAGSVRGLARVRARLWLHECNARFVSLLPDKPALHRKCSLRS